MSAEAPPPYQPGSAAPAPYGPPPIPLTPPAFDPTALDPKASPPAFDPTATAYPSTGYPVTAPPVGQPVAPAGYPGVAAPPLPPGARALDMPTGLFRLILPAGWPAPPLSWVAEWAGKPVSPGQPPAGAQPVPAGWVFWQPIEPQWSQWYARVRSAQLRWVLIGSGITVAALIFTIVGYLASAHGGSYYVLWGAIIGGAITAIRAGVILARLTRDPWSLIRPALTAVASR